MNYTIIGASGDLGCYLMRYLVGYAGATHCQAIVYSSGKTANLKAQHVQVVRTDYQDQGTQTRALLGTDVLVYIPSETYDVQRCIGEFETMLTAAKNAAVKQLIFVSFFADQEHNPFVLTPFYGYATRRLATTGMPYVVVKNALYADRLIPHLPELVRNATLTYPVGDKALSFISLSNSAEAIAKVAVTPMLHGKGQSYTLTQPSSLTMPELAHVLTMTTGEKIGYEPAPVQQRPTGDSFQTDDFALKTLFEAGQMGFLDIVSDDFETIIGRPADGMAAVLKEKIALI
ncbi:NmrA family NAD(P)-binding protein [Secundilactobacillus collinoides]|uniref:3-beta hydroxysteroid dehydrogenase isomerase n=1 Tax=Secundilactobacillus collinoides DSM 20515 = JCM 1123 TaxID=1423733 RepID=A0A0R2BHK2_SECCO|nr:NmrA family NAD(P)-binding protein [Secundilactobacillus collinoides]KRM75212.1 3-beta hydroxysteroid dehydrogenase isomerase [Secundilactobacillus collinoides DSM 20515 = JCM 1123]